MDYALITNPGTRDQNEDSLIALEDDRCHLFVVADGLGGHGKGEVASALVVDTFKKIFQSGVADADTFLQQAFTEVQSNILCVQRAQNSPYEMMTTCVALLTVEDVCRIGYIGDSRAYVFLKNRVKARTLDHSVPQMLVTSGEIKERQIRNHPDRNRLLRALGSSGESPGYEILDAFHLSEAQALLLCTDGFWELCDEKRMCALLRKSADAAQWLEAMTNEVKKNLQGRAADNYTAIAILVRNL